MFRSFFLNRRWMGWSVGGSFLIALSAAYMVYLDLQINKWFGDFYDALQKALGTPGSVTLNEFLLYCLTFARIAGILIVIAVVQEFFGRHFIFRWRTAMNDYYTANWHKLRHIEGAAQRVQEDTMRFARIMEHLGGTFLRAVMTLVVFMPLLWELSSHVKELPWIGEVSHAMVWAALASAAFGTVSLVAASARLPGLEFGIQKVEAAYRKELVLGEDDPQFAGPQTLAAFYAEVRKKYFSYYINYLYFDLVKWSYLQASVIFPYAMLGPTVITGAITLGIFNQIVRAFGKVETSFQFLVNSWGTIVELISIYKRLKAFERQLGKV